LNGDFPLDFDALEFTQPDRAGCSLYFHIPFCSKKCPYCHFFVLPDEERFKKPFLSALLKEFQMRLPNLLGKRIVSIYFGGGTPTKWAPENYEVLLDAIRGSGVEVAIDCEITLEANPEDITLDLMRRFQALGINRVSIGVQSLIASDLVLLGRSHPAGRCVKAVQEVYAAGMGNISIDLMFELPMQTLKSWKQCLSAVSRLPITHLSLYNLTFEPHTVFFKKRDQLTAQLATQEERLEMLQIAVESLEAMGLNRYEISAFAKRGLHSRHNTGYWTGRPFLGFGPSAFSYWEGARFSNFAHFNAYLTSLNQSQFPLDFEEKLNFPFNLQELLAVGLRLVAGVNMSHFERRYGSLPKDLKKKLQALIDKGWLCQEGNHVKLTPSGQLFYDSVASEII
jgi:oxygen-independent coproporphyrinogen-3 oxidase